MTKMIIQIPCFNEAETLAHTVNALPRVIEGISKIEWLVIDDGSSDDTGNIARQLGVDHVVTHTKNQGLAKAFYSGILYCLKQRADIIVNTDADNQYQAEDIEKLVKPILDKKADMVIGARPINEIKHFSISKKILQKFGSYVVKRVSKADVRDAPSGFRAFSSEAARQLNVFTGYTYTIETLIQAGLSGLKVLSVPIRVNPDLRPSRLIKNTHSYILKSIISIIRSYAVYRPFQFFIWPGITLLLIGMMLAFRFLYYFYVGEGAGHVQSVVFSSFLMMMGLLVISIGFLADLIGVNRKLLKNIEILLLNAQILGGHKNG